MFYRNYKWGKFINLTMKFLESTAKVLIHFHQFSKLFYDLINEHKYFAHKKTPFTHKK